MTHKGGSAIEWPHPIDNWRDRSTLSRLILTNIGVIIGYIAFAALSTIIVYRPQYNANWIVPVWLPNGFATYAILRYGKRISPGIFMGSIIAYMIPWIDGMLPAVAILVSIGNVLSLWMAQALFKHSRLVE